LTTDKDGICIFTRVWIFSMYLHSRDIWFSIKKSQKSLPKLNHKILSIQIIDIET